MIAPMLRDGAIIFSDLIKLDVDLAQTHQFLAANHKTNLTPDALSKRKIFNSRPALIVAGGASFVAINNRNTGVSLCV